MPKFADLWELGWKLTSLQASNVAGKAGYEAWFVVRSCCTATDSAIGNISQTAQTHLPLTFQALRLPAFSRKCFKPLPDKRCSFKLKSVKKTPMGSRQQPP